MADHENTTRDWSTTEFVQKHINAAGDHAAAAVKYWSYFWAARNHRESPLETIFEVWWRALMQVNEIGLDLVLHAQYAVVACGRNYRVDYRILPLEALVQRAYKCGVPLPKVCVELDGHDFHERTKEQVTYRNQRDRDLQSEGWTVLHFSGSELNQRPAQCIKDTYQAAVRLCGWDFECAVMDAEGATAETKPSVEA